MLEIITLSNIEGITDLIQKEAKTFFPDSTDKQLQWCIVKGALAFATQMAHFLRTARDRNGYLVFPDIFPYRESLKKPVTPAECAQDLYMSQTKLLETASQYFEMLKNPPRATEDVNDLSSSQPLSQARADL